MAYCPEEKLNTKILLSRTAALILVVLMLAASFPVSAASKAPITLDALTLGATVVSSTGSVSYDSGEDAVLIISDGTAVASFTANLSAVSVNTSALPYVVIVSRAPMTNSAAAVTASVELLGTGTVASSQFTPHKGYKYSYAVVPVHDAAIVKSGASCLTVRSSPSSLPNDVLMVSSVSFCPDIASADALAATLVTTANASRDKYSEDVLTLKKYDLERYSIPYNEGNLVYSEAVFPLEEKNGTIAPIPLAYSADRIVSVRSSDYFKEYIYGVDYILEDGKLVILQSGRIQTVDYSTHYYTSPKDGSWNFHSRYDPSVYVDTGEHMYFHNRQIAVTYTHTDAWGGPVIANQGDGIPLTTEKLLNGSNLSLVFFGDSITGGGNSSADDNTAPFAETWPKQVPKMLSRIYSTSGITSNIVAYGGGTAESAYSMVSENVLPCDPDVVVLAFGENEAMNGDSASQFGNAIENIINTIRDVKPQCEFVLVASQRSNEEIFDLASQFDQLSELWDIASRYTGVIVCDVTNAHEYLIQQKKYSDCSGNNLCHVNDYIARLYTQSILAAMFTPDYNSYKRIPLARYDTIINRYNYSAAYQTKIGMIIADAKAKTNAASSVAQAETILRDTLNSLAALPTAAYTSVDTSNLVMTASLVKRIAVGATYNAVPSFDTAEGALAVTVSGDGSDPYITLDLSCGMTDITDKKYMTITYRTDSANSDAARDGEMFVSAGELYCATAGASARLAYSADASVYHSVTLNLSDTFYATGTLHSLRYDIFDKAAAGDRIYIDSIIFSESKAAARTAEKSRLTARGVTDDTISFMFDSYSDVSDTTVTAYDTYMGGELTGDGRINALDALKLKLFLNGNASSFVSSTECGDLNGDGRINALDALRLKLFLNGKAELGMIRGADFFTSQYDADEKSLVLTATSNTIDTPSFTLDMSTFGITAASGEVGRIALTGKVIKADKSSSDVTATVYAGNGTDADTTALAALTLTTGGEIANAFASCADSTIATIDALKVKLDGITAGDKIVIHAVTLAPSQASLDERCDTVLRTLSLGAGSTPMLLSDNVKLDFTASSALSLITTKNNTSAGIDGTEGAMKLTVTGTRIDPWILLDLSAKKMSADQYKYIVLSYKYPTSNTKANAETEVFLSAGSITEPTADKSVTFSPTLADSYNTQVIDLTSTSFWNGNIFSIRLDYFCDASLGDSFFLDSVTFCKSTDGVNEALSSAR